MKREIKFRGLRTDDKGWVYGDLLHLEKDFKKIYKILHWQSEEASNEVFPETVGQFTGLKDLKDNDIFEGDWLQIPGYCCEVRFMDGGFHTVYNHPEDGETLPICDLDTHTFTVVGNIHESPELLNN